MKCPTILTTAALMAGFVSFGNAVCPSGDIAIGLAGEKTWSIIANDCGRISEDFNGSSNGCGSYGNAQVDCVNGVPNIVHIYEQIWGNCYSDSTADENCETTDIMFCCSGIS